MKNIRFAYILEIVWLCCAVIALLAGVHKTVVNGFSESYIFFIIVVISFLMYSVRRYIRKNVATESNTPASEDHSEKQTSN